MKRAIGLAAVASACGLVFAAKVESRTPADGGADRAAVGTISVDVASGSAFPVFTDPSQAVAVVLRSDSPRDWRGEIVATDFFGAALTSRVDRASAEGVRTLLPPPRRFGAWQVVARLDDGTEFGPARFACVPKNDVTPRPGRDAFAMGCQIQLPSYTPEDRRLAVRAAAMMGAKVVRLNFCAFKSVCAASPASDFSTADEIMALLEPMGVKVCANIYGTPRWARREEDLAKTGEPWYAYPPREGLYRDFCRALAAHYGEKIAWYEIGNEWDLVPPEVLPFDEAVRVLREAHEGVRSGCASARVVPNGWAVATGASLDRARPDFHETLMEAAKGNYDAHAIHIHGPYAHYVGELAKLFAWRKARGVTAPWFPNETALTCVNGQERAAARDVWRKILYGWAHGAVSHSWYQLRSSGDNPKSHEDNYGLMTRRFTPRYTYGAFAALTHLLNGATFAGAFCDTPARQVLRFKTMREGVPEIVVVGFDAALKAERSVGIPFATDARRALAYDLMGNETEVAVGADGRVTLRVDETPRALRLVGATFAKTTHEAVRRGMRETSADPDGFAAARPIRLDPTVRVRLSATFEHEAGFVPRLKTRGGVVHAIWLNGRRVENLEPARVGDNRLELEVTGEEFRAEIEESGKTCAATPESFQLTDGVSKVSPDGKNRISYGNGCMTVSREGRVLFGPQPVALKLDRGRADVELVARDDGVAYRFVADVEGEVTVLDETCSLVFPSSETEIWTGYNWCDNPKDPKQDKLQHGCASIYTKTTPGAFVPDGRRIAYLPLTVRYPDGTTVLFSESDLRDYAGLHLRRNGGETNRLDGVFGRYPVREREWLAPKHYRRVKEREDFIVKTSGRRTFPWRVFAITERPIGLSEQRLVRDLAAAPEGDFSWVRPGLATWEWWNAWHLEDVPFAPGVNTETYKAYIDFAAEYRLPWLLVDEGWKVGDDLYETVPAFDLDAIVRYAADRDVQVMLWTSWRALDGRQDEYFAHFARRGVKGFKIDFMERDDAEMMRFIEETLKVAAKHRLCIDFHGCGKPTGLEKTYPNLIGIEGVHGLELMKLGFADKDDFPAHDCQVVFTRAPLGMVDYTPGAMQNRTRSSWHPDNMNPASQGTRVHQMALYTLFPVPFQTLCDSPSRYRKNPECTRFLADMPTVWNETRGLTGEIGKFAAVARRKGADWWVGAITDWSAREIDIDTSFLGAGTWKAEIFADADLEGERPESWDRTVRQIVAGRPLRVRLAPGGGWTARFIRERVSRADCPLSP